MIANTWIDRAKAAFEASLVPLQAFCDEVRADGSEEAARALHALLRNMSATATVNALEMEDDELSQALAEVMASAFDAKRAGGGS